MSLLEKLFAKIDTDNSGHISKAEFTQLFKNIDKDGSGTVSRDEWVSGFAAMMGGDGSVAAKAFDALDADKSGEVDEKEISDLFDKMDTDKNGDVSKDEFMAVWKNMLG